MITPNTSSGKAGFWQRSSQATAQANVPVKPVPDSGKPVQLPADPKAAQPLQTIIRPSARDRWMASYLHYYTPQMVENIARGAMSGNLVAQWLMFDLMEQTWPRLVKNLNELKDAVTDLDWNLQAHAPQGIKPSAEAVRRSQIIQQILWDMNPDMTVNENDFDDTLRDLMDAIGKGISVLEVDWDQKDISLDLKGTGSLVNSKVWRPRATRWVHPRYYGYPPYGANQDRLMLNAQEITQSNPEIKFDDTWVPFPENRFLISIMKMKSGHPINSALLRILGLFWSAQNFTWEWFINLAQIFGAPIRWATYDTTKPGLQEIVANMLQMMGSQAWAAMPEGTKLELKEGVQNAQNNPQKVLIDSADQICDILILGQTLTTSQGDRGSQSLGTVHKSVRDEKIQAVASRTAKIINKQLLPAICRLNFGDDSECPYLVPSSKDGKSAMEKAQTYQLVLSSGAAIPRQFYYEQLDIPTPQPGEEVINPTNLGSMIKPPLLQEDDQTDPNQPDPNVATASARANAATEALTNNVLENLTGVQMRWLGGLKPVFRELVQAAQSGEVSDAQFIATLDRAKKKFPELFSRLDTQHLADALERAMGSAAVNGAVRGMMERRGAR